MAPKTTINNMGKISFEFDFKIGDKVYYKVGDPDESQGIITDIQYNALSGNVFYEVSFGWSPDDAVMCSKFELTTEKPIEL